MRFGWGTMGVSMLSGSKGGILSWKALLQEGYGTPLLISRAGRRFFENQLVPALWGPGKPNLYATHMIDTPVKIGSAPFVPRSAHCKLGRHGIAKAGQWTGRVEEKMG